MHKTFADKVISLSLGLRKDFFNKIAKRQTTEEEIADSDLKMNRQVEVE